MVTHFRPERLLPPRLGEKASEYAEYLSAYDMYLAKLTALRASWKESVATVREETKSAARKGKQLKVSYRTEDVHVGVVDAQGVESDLRLKVGVRKTEEVEAPKGAPKASSDKKAALKAKRQRYRRNRRVRALKERADLAGWKIVCGKKEQKARAILSKKEPKPGKKLGKGKQVSEKAPEVKKKPQEPVQAVVMPKLRPIWMEGL